LGRNLAKQKIMKELAQIGGEDIEVSLNVDKTQHPERRQKKFFASFLKNISGDSGSQEKNSISVEMISPDEWEKYKKIRLEALKNHPEAFGAQYEREAKRTDEEWQEIAAKFQDPKYRLKMFAARDGDEFVGMGGFFRGDPGVANLFELYVKKDQRGKNIGAELLAKILSTIEQDGRFNQVKLVVNKEQKEAFSLYEKFGFRVTEIMKDDNLNLQNSYLMVKNLERSA
jgi:diamine N-acetyltransferase